LNAVTFVARGLTCSDARVGRQRDGLPALTCSFTPTGLTAYPPPCLPPHTAAYVLLVLPNCCSAYRTFIAVVCITWLSLPAFYRAGMLNAGYCHPPSPSPTLPARGQPFVGRLPACHAGCRTHAHAPRHTGALAVRRSVDAYRINSLTVSPLPPRTHYTHRFLRPHTHRTHTHTHTAHTAFVRPSTYTPLFFRVCQRSPRGLLRCATRARTTPPHHTAHTPPLYH